MSDLEPWQHAWRVGFCPQLDLAELSALRDALATADPALVQRTTCKPALEMGESGYVPRDPKPAAACAIGLCGWRGRGLQTRDAVEAYFAHTMWRARMLLGGNYSDTTFTHWFDTEPLDVVRPLLLAEVNREIALRKEGV